MRQVFFNSFKEKILNGQVPECFDVHGTPVTSEFIDTFDNTDIKLEQYKNLDDFDKYSKGNNTKSLEQTTFKYEEFGVEYSAYYDNDVSEKPLFVNPDNWDKFLQIYSGEIGYDDSYVKSKFESYIECGDVNINSGFYYVQKKSQLKWIAERCNNKENFNNRLIVVMGDDIGSEAGGYQLLDTVICDNPNRPFQGIFDFNGHRISNLIIECKENSNGIIGYLGGDGIVRDAILNNVLFRCSNKISLEKIRTDCSDVVVGGVVGTNYGRVENVITSGVVQFNGFCPEVYLASNKHEYEPYDNIDSDTNYNCFFPSKFCINSLYNVIPYVGYFCEGADSYFNDIGDPIVRVDIDDGSDAKYSRSLYNLTQNNVDALLGRRIKSIGMSERPASNFNHFEETSLGNNEALDTKSARLTDYIGKGSGQTGLNWDKLHSYQCNAGHGDVLKRVDRGTSQDTYPPMISMEDDQNLSDRALASTVQTVSTLKSWNEMQEEEVGDPVERTPSDDPFSSTWEYGVNLARQMRDQLMLSVSSDDNQQVTTHQKMNPYSRVAYFCSPVVGNNFGTIVNIDCRHRIRESSDTFVGFIGNVCGKHNCGTISNVKSMVDIRTLSDEEKKSSPLSTRVYTDNRSYVPEYSEDYANLINVFGYNWDYYQSPHGLNEDDLSIYSATSASAARATDKFYTFHDICYSGVQLNDHYEINDDSYVFNKMSTDTSRAGNIENAQRYCNFKLPGYESEDSGSIGNLIPADIREAKLKLSLTSNSEESLNTFTINAAVPLKLATERSTFKLYNPYEAEKCDNVYQKLDLRSDELENELDSVSSVIEHMDMSYIGDACKYLSVNDPMKIPEVDGHEITTSDLLNYCSNFSGACGMTVSNAREFAANVMNAKVANGCEMLLNPALEANYTFPGGNQPFDGNDGLFGTTNSHDGDFVIPAHTGPNETDTDWNMGDNIADFCWYMQPGFYKEGETDGPEGFNSEVLQMVGSTSQTTQTSRYNTEARKPNFFCSVNRDGLWDLYGLEDEHSSETFYNSKNYFETNIPKTRLKISPRSGDSTLDAFGKYLVDAASANEAFRNILGDREYSVKLNEITIPVLNRTQNGAYQSSEFEGVANVSGVYLDYRRQPSLWELENGLVTASAESSEAYGVNARVGNLDYMYIDLSIITRENSYSCRAYPMIVKLPIDRLRVPVSAITAGPIAEETVSYSENLAMIRENVNVKFRSVKYYNLLPAYDALSMAGNQVEYKLKSIYNIGGICGMINHCAKYTERGNNELYESTGYGPSANRADCGSIENCYVKFTKSSVDYIRNLLLKRQNGNQIEDINDRTISIANKFGGVAAVYEYRQNDVGTSPASGIETYGPDTLNQLDVQPFKIDNICIGGYERFYTGSQPSEEDYKNRSLFKMFSKIFSPFIEWSNVGNILDTTNMFLIDDRAAVVGNRFRGRHSSNFPISANIAQSFGIAMDSINDFYTGQNRSFILGDAHPVIADRRIIPTAAELAREDGHGKVTWEKMNLVGSNANISGATNWRNIVTKFYPRLRFTKTYELLPGLLIRPSSLWYYGDLEILSDNCSHMSPVSNAPCSEYNDVYMQMFGGNPNFINRKLGKPIMLAPIQSDNVGRFDIARAKILEEFNLINTHLVRAYQDRYEKNNGITDRYFTWDYDMKNVKDLSRSKSPLDFTIRYGIDYRGTRGLWIHQNDPYTEDPARSWIQYSMKGKDYCKNDGSNIRLGYLPSDWSIVELLNRNDENDMLPENQYEEGRAIVGEDFRGILLADENRDLVAFIDGGYGRDLTSGCYIAQLTKKKSFEENGSERLYGLLSEIKVEN